MQWLMLQQNQPEDFVISTGIQHSVLDFINAAAEELDISIHWLGECLHKKGYNQSGEIIVAIDSSYFRPTEVEELLGDSSKAKEKLGWKPKITFKELVSEMILADLELVRKERVIKDNGFKVPGSRVGS